MSLAGSSYSCPLTFSMAQVANELPLYMSTETLQERCATVTQSADILTHFWFFFSFNFFTFYCSGCEAPFGQMTWCKWRRTKCERVKCALLAQWTVGYNAYAAPILNCIWRFWLKLNSKCTQMNYEMNCIKPCTDVQRNGMEEYSTSQFHNHAQ